MAKGSKRAKWVNSNKDLQLSQALRVTLLNVCLGIWRTGLRIIFRKSKFKGQSPLCVHRFVQAISG